MALSFLGSTARTQAQAQHLDDSDEGNAEEGQGRPRFVRQAISRNILLRAPGELGLSPEWL